MEPVYETMNGQGNIKSDKIVIEGGSFLQNLSETLKSPGLAKQTIKDLDASFVIENGKITTEPFDISMNEMTATVSGYSTFDQKIDYVMEMEVPTDALGSGFSKMAEGLMGQANAFLGSDLSMGKTIDVDLNITGDLTDPKISPSFGGMGGEGSVTDQAKEAVKEKVEETIDEGKEKAREEAAKQAEKILNEAQKKADRVVEEAEKAAQRIRDEADKQAQKLVDKASNPIAKKAAEVAAKKVRNEADDKADKLESEAQKQADKIMADAREKADKIKEEG
jgi:vacuolar-type H+-ATPase subunit H